jgi:hypothetical protein
MQEFIDSLKNKTVRQLNELMCDYSEKGDLEKIKILLTSPFIDNHAEISDNEHMSFIMACRSGNLELVKYLLSSSELKEHSDINAQHDIALSDACHFKNFSIVKYLIESPELKKHSKIPFVHVVNNNPIVLAAKYNHPEMFEYLISVSENKDDRIDEHLFRAGSELGTLNDLNLVKPFIKIAENKTNEVLTSLLEGIINGACSEDNIQIIKYVFGSPNLAQYIDIHKDNDSMFSSILLWSRIGRGTEVARYFIFDLNIEETEKIKNLRSSNSYEPIEKMFNVRNLTKTLEQDLPSSPHIKKSKKI